MRTAAGSYTTVTGVVEAWQDAIVSAQAWNEYVSGVPSGSIKPLGRSPERSGGTAPVGKRISRIWMARPWRWRVETQPPVAPLLATVVIDGGLWWSTDGRGEASTNEGAAGQTTDATGLDATIVAMLVPQAINDSFRFEVAGPRLYRGRRAMKVDATPASDSPTLWPVADRVALVIDAERGVILSWSAYRNGAPYASRQFVEIDFDGPIGSEVFRFTPPPGMRVRHFDEHGVR